MNLRKFHILAMGFLLGMTGLATTSCTGTATDGNSTGAGPTVVSCDELLSGTGMTTLSWTAPTQNTDDSPLSTMTEPRLAGYVIYFGSASGSMACSINVDNAYATTYEITNLLTNTEYTFAVTAYNSDYVESDLSIPVIRTIN